MIGQSVLWEVIGPHPIAAIAGANLLFTLGSPLGGDATLFGLVDAAAQQGHGPGPVLDLAALVLACDHGPCRQVRNPHGGVRLVDVLPARPRRPVGVDPQVASIDVNVDLFDFGQHGDRRRRRVDPPLSLGLRDALHAMATGLELHRVEDVLSLDADRRLFEAAGLRWHRVHRLDRPPHA